MNSSKILKKVFALFLSFVITIGSVIFNPSIWASEEMIFPETVFEYDDFFNGINENYYDFFINENELDNDENTDENDIINTIETDNDTDIVTHNTFDNENEIDFDIDGRTRPFALLANGEFREGERIYGKENLEKYISLKRQLLLNQRVLEEVNIEYSLGAVEKDGAIPVSLIIFVKDTWNLIILPYPKYDSNEGFSITIKARDYNFLGTMSALKFDLG